MTAQNLMTRAQFDSVAAEFRPVVQQAGLRVGVIAICAADSESPDDLRRSLVRQLQRTLPQNGRAVRADGSRLPNAEFAKHEQQVRAAVLAAAHQSPELREVITTDRAGREVREFYGEKKSWMAPYSGPVQRMTKIDGVPVTTLPVIVS